MTLGSKALAVRVTAGLRILLVDDEPSILRMFRTALANYGYATEQALTVSHALGLLEAGAFDAVVSDVNMPDGGGFDLLAAMRARGLRVPVIIMTGKPAATLSKRAETEGAWRAVVKPVMPATLRDLIETIVSERKTVKTALPRTGP